MANYAGLKKVLATASGAAAIALFSAAEPWSMNEQQDDFEELLARVTFSMPDPHIKGMQVHHVIDKNGDGKIQVPEEIEKIYLDSASKYLFRIKKPFPAVGALVFYVPEHEYWGTTIDTKIGYLETLTAATYTVREHTSLSRPISATKTNVIDLTLANQTNSSWGTALRVAEFPLEENGRRMEKIGKTEKITYTLTVIGHNGTSHSYMYTVDYSAKRLQTNDVTVVTK